MQEGFKSGGTKQRKKNSLDMGKRMVIVGSGYKGINGNKKYNKRRLGKRNYKFYVFHKMSNMI